MSRSRIAEIRTQLKNIETSDWKLVGVRVEHGGDVNIDAIDDFHKSAKANVRFLLDEIDRLHNQYAHEGGIPQIMTREILERWLKALHIPSVVDISVANVPNVFYVMFNGSLEHEHKLQLQACNLEVIWVNAQARNLYMLKWRTPPNDEY